MWQVSEMLMPTVIAAVVAAAVSLLTLLKQQTGLYITKERALWRSRIKEAMQKLIGGIGNKRKTQLALQRIKSEINPYGQNLSDIVAIKSWLKNTSKEELSEYFYLADGHIWEAIIIYENATLQDKEYKLHVLLRQLEYMLKYDWERSKSEVQVNKFLVFSALCSVTSMIVLAAINWTLIQEGILGLQIFACLFSGILLVIYAPYLLLNKVINKKIFIAITCFGLLSLTMIIIINPMKTISLSLLVFLLGLAFVLSVAGILKSKQFQKAKYVSRAHELRQEAGKNHKT